MPPSRTRPPWSPASGAARLAAVLGAALLLLSVPPLQGTDWPQFRGPGRDGIARDEPVARAWAESGPPVLWKRAFGSGFSSISVVGDRLYTMSSEGDTEDILCLDAATGKTLWRAPIAPRFPEQFGDGPRATPTVDGDRVYAISSDVQLAAVKRATGEILWHFDLKEKLQSGQPRFGYGSSPLVDGGLLIVDVGGKAGVVAFDKLTGEVRWKALQGPAGAASPFLVEIGGRRQYVFHRWIAPKTLGLVGISPEGEVLWSHPGALDNIATPIFVPPDRFFISAAAMGDGGKLVRVHAGEEGFTAEEVWAQPRMRNHFNTSVLVDGYLYGFDNSTFRSVSVETGELQWAMRGFGKGSLLASGDLLFVLSDSGILALVQATPKAFTELARTRVMSGRSWTAPTLAGGRLYLRDLDEMLSLEVGPKVAATPSTAGPASAPTPTATTTPAPETAAGLVARYTAARGGLEAWRKVKSLRLTGTYATFSQIAPFSLLRQRGEPDLYRFDFRMLGEELVHARDAEGFWWIYPLLEIPQPTRLDPKIPYGPQLSREADFEPLLLGAEGKGVEVQLKGRGEIDGRPTLILQLTLPGGAEETWHLDATTYLEIAVDSKVHDYTQFMEPVTQRTYFADFRRVGDLTVPFSRTLEFGARLEEMKVEKVEIDPEIEEGVFRFPKTEAAAEIAEGDSTN